MYAHAAEIGIIGGSTKGQATGDEAMDAMLFEAEKILNHVNHNSIDLVTYNFIEIRAFNEINQLSKSGKIFEINRYIIAQKRYRNFRLQCRSCKKALGFSIFNIRIDMVVFDFWRRYIKELTNCFDNLAAVPRDT